MLDANKPADSDLICELGLYLRETRAAINTLTSAISGVAGLMTSETVLVVAPGQTELVVGTDVADVVIETLRVSAAGSETIENILGARSGQIKIIVFEDDDVSITHDLSKIVLNGGSTFGNKQGDTIALRNEGGIPANNVNGKWIEVFRSEYVL